MDILLLLLALANLAGLVYLATRPRAAFPPDLLARLDGIEAVRASVEQVRYEVAVLRADGEGRAVTARQEAAAGLAALRDAVLVETRASRTEAAGQFTAFDGRTTQQLAHLNAAQKQELDRFGQKIDVLAKTLAEDASALRDRIQGGFRDAAEAQIAASDKLRGQVQERLEALQQSNDARLAAMQQTVDEKLQTALDTKLTESFKTVSERLELVHQGLGEMRDLASSVGDLKKVMTNVKTRGTWGEVLLGNLIEEVLPGDRFERNWAPPRRSERVEFAIKLPGSSDDNRPVFLPVDAKFPKEDYERLQAAADAGDVDGVAAAQGALHARVTSFARDVRDKYIVAPHTTDFAILFLPTEGLYAEVLREPALVDRLQREFRVIVAGPTTLLAILNSLQMGFRTLALQKKSAEIAGVLSAVKTEFVRFEEVIVAVRDRIRKAADELDDKVGVRTRKITSRLRAIEALPDEAAAALLGPLVDEAPVDEA